jgi:hypothetical protein
MQDTKERGQIPLQDCHVIAVPEDKYKKTLCFEVVIPSNNRIFLLHGTHLQNTCSANRISLILYLLLPLPADTQGDLQGWIDALQTTNEWFTLQKTVRRQKPVSKVTKKLFDSTQAVVFHVSMHCTRS